LVIGSLLFILSRMVKQEALIETIIGIQALRGSKEWNNQDLETSLSEEALTTAVMQRYHVNVAVKRDLGSKLGSRIIN